MFTAATGNQGPRASGQPLSRFAGKSVIVTGGGGEGLGGLLCEEFAREGASVVVADISAERAEAVAQAVLGSGGRALPVAVDVSSAASVEHMRDCAIDAFGRIDVLVNNAMFSGPDTDLVNLGESDWARPIEVVLDGAFLCSRAVLPGMISSRAGAIVNIGSVNALAYFGNESYSAAKAGLASLTRSIAARYGRHGVRANMVAPGTLRTTSPAWQARTRRDPTVFERLGDWYPLGRVGLPSDVSPAVLFLASEEAGWISGVVLPVDGGLLSGYPKMASDLLAGPSWLGF